MYDVDGMYKIRLALLTVLCYLQLVYEIDVMIPLCAGCFAIERWLKFIAKENIKCQVIAKS
jgi:hypothetical protein